MHLEREWEEIIKDLIINNSTLECDEREAVVRDIASISTFKEAGMLTYNHGVVVDLEDGKQIQITIVRTA